jgi:hypothetical protein
MLCQQENAHAGGGYASIRANIGSGMRLNVFTPVPMYLPAGSNRHCHLLPSKAR